MAHIIVLCGSKVADGIGDSRQQFLKVGHHKIYAARRAYLSQPSQEPSKPREIDLVALNVLA